MIFIFLYNTISPKDNKHKKKRQLSESSCNPLTIRGLRRARAPKSLTISDLENFYPPIALTLGDDSVPPILSLLVSEGSRCVFINEFIH
jgi:hypothetical protein